MANRLGVRGKLDVGSPTVLDTMSEDGNWYVTFEDDGQTGYFYAADCSGESMAIRGALHIYNVRDLPDDDPPSTVDIVWSTDDGAVALAINDVPHAAFDLVANRAACRTGAGAGEFPSPYEWDEAMFSPFYE